MLNSPSSKKSKPAFGAGIDDHVAGAMVGMDVHLSTAIGAVNSFAQRVFVQRWWNDVFAPVLPSQLGNYFPENHTGNQNPSTVGAKDD